MLWRAATIEGPCLATGVLRGEAVDGVDGVDHGVDHDVGVAIFWW